MSLETIGSSLCSTLVVFILFSFASQVQVLDVALEIVAIPNPYVVLPIFMFVVVCLFVAVQERVNRSKLFHDGFFFFCRSRED